MDYHGESFDISKEGPFLSPKRKDKNKKNLYRSFLSTYNF